MPRLLLAILSVVLLAALVAFSSAPVAAHGGGIDKHGCHNDKKAGTYHCHQGPCAGKSFASQAAMLRDACSR